MSVLVAAAIGSNCVVSKPTLLPKLSGHAPVEKRQRVHSRGYASCEMVGNANARGAVSDDYAAIDEVEGGEDQRVRRSGLRG